MFAVMFIIGWATWRLLGRLPGLTEGSNVRYNPGSSNVSHSIGRVSRGVVLHQFLAECNELLFSNRGVNILCKQLIPANEVNSRFLVSLALSPQGNAELHVS